MNKIFFLFVFLFLSSCSDNNKNYQSKNYEGNYEKHYGGTLKNAMVGEPNNLIAMIAGDSASSAIAGKIFNTLLTYDENLNLTGEVAKSWKLSSDKKTITFYLNTEMHWADSVPLTCKDIYFTWKVVTNPETRTPYASDYQLVKKAECKDDHTFIITYQEPYAPALDTWATLHILPKHKLEHEDINNTFFSRNPTGSSFYKLKEWVPGQYLSLETNENSILGKPFISKMISRIIPDLSSQFMELSAENLDFMSINPIQYKRIFPERKDLNNNYELNKELGNGYTYFGFNLQKKPFNNINIRKAIDLAINKQEIIDGVLLGLGFEITSPYKPETFWYNSNISKTNFNPDEAKRLIESEGFKLNEKNIYSRNGELLKFEILTNQNKQREMTAVLIQRRLKEIGVDVSIRVLEWASFINQYIKTGDFESVVLGWSLSLDPDQFNIWHSTQNGPGQFNFINFNNKRVDKLLERGRKELDIKKRKQIYDEFSEIIYEEKPVIFLYAGYGLNAIHKRIKGIKNPPPPAGTFHFMEKNWYIPSKFIRNEIN